MMSDTGVKKVDVSKRWSEIKSKYREAAGKDKKKPKEPFGTRFLKFCKRWIIRIFHTVFFLVFTYVFILSCISVLPLALSYILGATGFTLANNAEILLMMLTGLFFVAWIFAISLFVIKKALGLYIRNMKKTLSQEFINKYKGEASDDNSVNEDDKSDRKEKDKNKVK